MKKLLSVFCMAVLAGGMIFTSCTKNFTITTAAEPAEGGTVTGGGTYQDGAVCTITAVPNEGWEFVDWQDNSKENPRKVTVTANETWTAHFRQAQPGAKVTFNNEVWEAGQIGARYYAQYPAWAVASAKTSLQELPQAQVASYLTNSGSATGNADADGDLGDDFAYVEYYDQTYLVDDNQNTYGDWWGKNITLNVTAFDATALTVSAKVSGTMFSALEAFVPDYGQVGVDAAPTAPMTYDITRVNMTAAKGTLAKKVAGKLVAAR